MATHRRSGERNGVFTPLAGSGWACKLAFMSTSSPRRRGPRILTTLLLLLVVYLLSLGPIHALYSSRRLPGTMPAVLAAFYKPADWLNANTPLGRPMAVHDDWWKGVLKRP